MFVQKLVMKIGRKKIAAKLIFAAGVVSEFAYIYKSWVGGVISWNTINAFMVHMAFFASVMLVPIALLVTLKRFSRSRRRMPVRRVVRRRPKRYAARSIKNKPVKLPDGAESSRVV